MRALFGLAALAAIAVGVFILASGVEGEGAGVTITAGLGAIGCGIVVLYSLGKSNR